MKDMINIINRINEIKSRFGLTKNTSAAKTENAGKSFETFVENAAGNSTGAESVRNTPEAINGIIDHYSGVNKISPSLIKAMVEVESGYNAKAVSPKGARGLMQLMPSVMKDMEVGNPFVPDENIRGGVAYMKSLLESYNGDYIKALAAYNAGKGAVEKHGGVPDYQETKEYIDKVIGKYLENR